MSHGRNKYQSRENRAKVNEILNRYWDPIGVAGRAPDQYTTYAAKAYVMLMDEGSSADAIAAYLLDIAIGHMGLSPSRELEASSRQAAERIAALRPSFTTH